MNVNTKITGHMGPLDTLLMIFVVLKLCGLINWSWWVVLIPLWVSVMIAFAIVGYKYKVEKGEDL